MPRAHKTGFVFLALIFLLCTPSALAQPAAPPAPDTSNLASPKLKTFGIQLLHNFGATFTSKQNLLPLAVGGGATAASLIWEKDIQEYFAETRRARVVGETGKWLGSQVVIGGISGGVLLIGYKSENHKLRRVGYDLAQSNILSLGMTRVVKVAIGRERPNGENKVSFVSGHSSRSFAIATVISHHYPRASIPAYLAAAFVAFSRIELNKHWISDTIGGATLGFIVAKTVIREDKKLAGGRISFSPQILPGGGIGVAVSLRL